MPDFLTFLWPVFSHEEKHNLSGITSCRKQRLKIQFDLSLEPICFADVFVPPNQSISVNFHSLGGISW